MIRSTKLIFCDNEHGAGDVTFPDLDDSSFDIKQHFIYPVQPTAAELRKAAKKAGWTRVDGGDYCPICSESEEG